MNAVDYPDFSMGAYLSMPEEFEPHRPPPISDDAVALHHPSEADVLAVRSLLLHHLPLELADIILDLAMYWLRIVTCETRSSVVHAIGRPRHDASFVYLVTQPFPPPQHTQVVHNSNRLAIVKMVRFSLSSHDQGWGGEQNLDGPYHGSYTWFEAAIYRYPDSGESKQAKTRSMIWESQDELRAAGVTQVPNPANGERTWLIQRNVRASSEVRHHTVTWTSVDTSTDVGEVPDGPEDTDTGCGRGVGFVRSLVAGDRIAIVARALYPGWANHVSGVQVEVFYSV